MTSRSRIRLFYILAVLAFLALFVRTAEHWLPPADGAHLLNGDSPQYARMGFNLAHYGILSRSWDADEVKPSAYREPLYPALLALGIKADPELSAMDRDSMFNSPGIIVAPAKRLLRLNFALLMASAVLAAAAVRVATGQPAPALAALVAVGLSPGLHYHAAFFQPELLVALLLTGLSLALMLALRHQKWWLYAGAGLSLGLLTLTRATYQYFPIAALALFAVSTWRAAEMRRRVLAGSAAFVLGFVLVVGPWVARNVHHLGRAFVAERGGVVLNIRAYYDLMTPAEYRASFLYWTPGAHAKLLLGSLFEPDDYRNLNRNNAEGYYQRAKAQRTELHREEDSAVRGDAAQIEEAKGIILGHPVRHLLVTLPMAWRGMFVDPWLPVPLNVALSVLLLALAVRSAWRWRPDRLGLLLPMLFTMAFHALLTHDIPRYNVPGIPVLWIATVVVLHDLARDRLRLPELIAPRAGPRSAARTDSLALSAALSLIVLVGFGLRARGLGGFGYSFAELPILRAAVDGPFDLRMANMTVTPTLVRQALLLGGDVELAARQPALFAGTLSIAALYALAARLGRRRLGAVLALILAVWPWHIGVSRQVGPMAVLICVGLVAALLLIRALERPSFGSWLALAIAVTLGLYTHVGGFLVFGLIVLLAGAIVTGSAGSPPIPQLLFPKGGKGSREVAESVPVALAGTRSVRRWRAGHAAAAPLVALAVVVVLALPWLPVLAGDAAGLSAVSGPDLGESDERTAIDWASLIDQLQSDARDSDVVLDFSALSRHDPLTASFAVRYQVQRARHGLRIVRATELKPEVATGLRPEVAGGLAEPPANVWAVVLAPAADLPDSVSTVEHQAFAGDLHLLRVAAAAGPTIEQAITLYSYLMPTAGMPQPRCELQFDLAVLLATAGDPAGSLIAIDASRELCPDLPAHETMRNDLHGVTLRLLVAYYEASGRDTEARAAAAELLAMDEKSAEALATLTVVDVLDRVEAGAAQIETTADEPVRRERFTMPVTGDWGDVLLLHPPASVSLDLVLPDQPVRLVSRVAMAPDSWEWGGDGAAFVVLVQRDGHAPVELYRQHVSNAASDRTWHPVSVSLAAYTGQAVTITLATEPGPMGDTTGDWAGWDTPRILWQVP